MNFCVFHILKTQKLKFTKVQQKSKKVLLLCFVAFVTFVFYAHRKIVKLSSFKIRFSLGFCTLRNNKKPSWENDFLTTFKLTLHCSFVMKIFLLRYILWSNTLLHKMNNAWNSCQLVGDHTFRAHPDVGPFSIIISWLLLLVRRL